MIMMVIMILVEVMMIMNGYDGYCDGYDSTLVK